MTLATGQRLQTLVGAGVVLLALGLGAGAAGISSEAGYGGVGPNFLPWVVAGALLLCGGFLLYEAQSGGFRDMEEPVGDEKPYWSGFVWMSTGLLLNAALITTIGFIFSCTLCFVMAARGLRNAQAHADAGVQSWLVDAVIGLLISAPVYWMFTRFLAISLPGITQTGWI
ncbi:MAG: tripartite tricarboxylate transporter TctB family protein [Burkholderiales bacterium]|nr:tripartite tricarboxylate transporter TctB family protein [Burkholderiales bacterium]